MTKNASDIARLRNLGPTSAAWLAEAGIHTRADLEAVGAVMAYKIVQHHRPEVNRLLLYALHGALEDVHWNSFSPAVKAELTREAEGRLTVSAEGASGTAPVGPA